MNNSVVKAASYVLVHVPDMVVHSGSTQATERVVNPGSEYLKQLPSHLRSFQDALAYAPNQTYIGNLTPDQLGAITQPFVDKPVTGASREGRFGEIMPQEEFLLLMQANDMFDLLHLDQDFVANTRPALEKHPLLDERILGLVKPGKEAGEIERVVKEGQAEGLYHQGQLVGYVKRAHDVDVNLSAHVMLENLASKASSVLALRHLLRVSGIPAEQIEYVIECSEEACGDVNQRGGGNIAKAAAEVAGLTGATGSDVRGFCAAPSHALVQAASLVKSGTFKNVAVVAGGATAKLGMNGKDHVKKGLPIIEDVLAGFAILISQNDGHNPEIDLSIIGRHTVGTGASPQAVTSSLVSSPLERAGMKIQDIDKFAAELQNPDITKPAGAGDVPQANFKMIAALAVKNGELARDGINGFIEKHGMVGWAPTQGHIPSGAPYLGFARQQILDGDIKTAMIIGKGSLFLGRLTNQFDGISFVLRKNQGQAKERGISREEVRGLIAQALRDFATSLDG